jgi:RNA polymerase sigma factor (TIGR02999 family)
LTQKASLPATLCDGVLSETLFVRIYAELHRIAQRELRREGTALTVGPTMLLHETYLSLRRRDGISFPDQVDFLAYASRAMRRLVIDYAHRQQAIKRGAAFELTELPSNVPEEKVDSAQLQRVSDAIDELSAVEPRLARVVNLKYFSGFSLTDIAVLWGESRPTVQRDWQKARLFLHHCLSANDSDAVEP